MKRVNKERLLAIGIAAVFGFARSHEIEAADCWVCAGNQASVQYEVYNPASTDWNSSGPVWTFAPTTANGWTSAEVAAYSNPSDMKLRYLGSGQVVVSCASGGLATIATYPGGVMKWTLDVGGSNNPHSVELLPNGNIAVAASTGGWVRVYAASQGSRNGTYTQYNLTGAHAALWDPQYNLLWVMGDSKLTALVVGGTAASPTLAEDTNRTISLSSGGHELSPFWGDANQLWVTLNNGAYIYDKATKRLWGAPGSANRTVVKGCGNQPSGEIVECQPSSACTLNTWCTPNIDFYTSSGVWDYTRTRTGAAFYKCRIFQPDYQPRDLPVIGAWSGQMRDVCRFHSADGYWHIRFGDTGNTNSFQYGQPGDLPMIGDWYTNGMIDQILFRPSTGTWFVRNGATNGGTFTSFVWGQNGDIPLIGAWSGQMWDAAVFRPSNATWYIHFGSNGSHTSFAWGDSGDFPLVGDWNTNGMIDQVLFRPSTGYWYVRNGQTGTVDSFQMGQDGDFPLIGAWSGQMRDAVAYRPSNSTWYIRFGNNGSTTALAWGNPGDVPLVCNYYGNGMIDQVLYRPATGEWFVRNGLTGAVISFAF